jgi:hypothetical protein
MGNALPRFTGSAVVEDEAMSVREFRDDDAGYLAWQAAHPDGYVINIARIQNATAARVHHAGARGPDRT